MLLVAAIAAAGSSCRAQALENILSPGRLPYLKESRLRQISSRDTTGGNADYVVIRPGERAVLASVRGPGVITKIWVTIGAKDPHFLRRILLRMYWDDEATPSVEVPIGDFFGTGFQYRHWVSPLLGMSSGGYYCTFPMPFGRSARVEAVNETGATVQSFYYHLAYQELRAPLDSGVAYFHAQWRREARTTPGRNYTVLEASGTGHVVGVAMSMQSYSRTLAFLEGDEMVYVDGEQAPSMYGTGTEDYFTGGWYFNAGEFAAPTHGLILKDDSLGRIAAYRFHLADAIPFTKSVRFTIEHGHANTEAADYSSTAFWYQREPHAPFPPMLPAAQRIPLRAVVPAGALEAEGLAGGVTGARGIVEEMGGYGPEWSGGRQLRVDAAKPGEAFSLTFPVGAEEEYALELYYTRGPGYGDYSVSVDGAVAGRIAGYQAEVAPGGPVGAGSIRPKGSKASVTITVTGKDPRSAGHAVGIDALALVPVRRFIPEWNFIGPFPNPENERGERTGLDTPYGPERSADLAAVHRGIGGKPLAWRVERTTAAGYFQISSKVDPSDHAVSYVLTYLHAPEDLAVPLLLGSDDGVKVFLNGAEAHRVLVIRIAEPDRDRVPLSLKKGWNSLLLKVENNLGGYGFYARLVDRDRRVRASVRPD